MDEQTIITLTLIAKEMIFINNMMASPMVLLAMRAELAAAALVIAKSMGITDAEEFYDLCIKVGKENSILVAMSIEDSEDSETEKEVLDKESEEIVSALWSDFIGDLDLDGENDAPTH